MKCDFCGKTPQFGNNVSHSKRHTRRRWVPNIHPTKLVVNGQEKRFNLCTRCLRTQHKTAQNLPAGAG
ncbi:MAG: 50S ribosomal protein L28 [Dehalococcoidales bacterium]|nr:50S ribosomal protein L28 [Dehalococcoidales bacterium]MDZ4230261.1 50S ribosomal protein L28 [Dehalococcoidales bacterium]